MSKITAKINYANKDKYKIPPPEDIVINKIYSFTINPEKQYSKQLVGYLHNDSDIVKLIKHPSIKYELHREISKAGRIHYHGFIQFINERELLEIFIMVIPKWMNNATFYIDTISDDTVWAEYCNKQKNLWQLNNIPSTIDGNLIQDLETDDPETDECSDDNSYLLDTLIGDEYIDSESDPELDQLN